MGKSSKILGVILLVLGLACIGMYFVMAQNSDHKVVFDSNGGSIVVEQIVKKDERAVKPQDPTKEDNEFVEWQLNGVAYNFDNVVTEDITLKASWKEIIKYNVKVTLEDKEYTGSIVEGEKITLEGLNIPAKEGYNVKFYNDKNEEFDIETAVSEELTLTAKYVQIKTYTVKFDSNGGSKVAEAKVVEGSKLEQPTVTRDGYILDGWYLGEEKFDFTTPITKDITLKARWNDGEKVNVIFTVDGSTYKTVSVKENTKVSKPTNPTKKGYKFVEWQLDGKSFDFNTKITDEITLTALFEESKTVTVTFDSDGGSKVSSKEVETGGKVTAPTAPTKDGYKFLEWDLNGKKYDFNSAVNDNIKLKAVWVKVYTVTFNTSGGSNVASQTIETGEKVKKPADPTKNGYKFVEWLLDNSSYDFNTPVTKDIELSAYFEKVVTPTPEPPTGDVESDEDK